MMGPKATPGALSLALVLILVQISAQQNSKVFDSIVSQVRADRDKNPDQGESLGIDAIYGMRARAEARVLKKSGKMREPENPQGRIFNFFRHHAVHLRNSEPTISNTGMVDGETKPARVDKLAGGEDMDPIEKRTPLWLKKMERAAAHGERAVGGGDRPRIVRRQSDIGDPFGPADSRSGTLVGKGFSVGDPFSKRAERLGAREHRIDSDFQGKSKVQSLTGQAQSDQQHELGNSLPPVQTAGIGLVNSIMPWSSNKSETDEEMAKIRLGIQIMSSKERESTILKCFDDGPFMDPRQVKAPNVSVGIYMLNLQAEKGLTEGTFFADFLIFFRREDRPLQKHGTKELMEQIAITNARKVDLTTNYHEGIWRIGGTFLFSPDLRWFPFDSQDLEILMEQLRVPIRDFHFIPDSQLNGMSPYIRFPGWQASLRLDSDSHYARCYASSGYKILPAMNRHSQKVDTNNLTFSRFSYNVQVQRPFWQGVLTHMIPPAIMLTPALFSYALNPIVHSTTQLASCSSSIVSILLFHIGIAGELPPVDYLTFFDKYIFAVYCTLFMALFSAMACSVIYRNESNDTITFNMKEALFQTNCRIGYISTVIIFAFALPVWGFCSSRAASLLLLPLALGGVIWVWIQWSDLRAAYLSGQGAEMPGLHDLTAKGPTAEAEETDDA